MSKRTDWNDVIRTAKWPRRLIIWVPVIVVSAIVGIVGAYYFDVATESRAFCGVLCHPNRPQYVAQEVSPHADVECGVCHIGPGLAPKVAAKILGARELYALTFNTYERPIPHPVNQLRPADVICEQCHSPQGSSGDEILEIARFAADEQNSETRTVLVSRIGGGGEIGAHWHIDNPVRFVGRDVDNQDIPWVSVTGPDGKQIEYQAMDNPLTPAELERLPEQEMDCMDCHNRATHQFRNPEERVDEALASGEIDRGLPYLKREATRLLAASYETQEAGINAMEGLAQFYRAEYPNVYAAQQEAVEQAVQTLQAIYRETTFPEMNVTWQAYPDNLGHTDSPGCFRCHDGQHVNAEKQPIPNNCTTCHSIPIVSEPGQQPEATLLLNAVVQGRNKPDSHRAPDFGWEHRILVDDTCADCHGSIQFGTDNESFCANGVCHGQDWATTIQEAAFVHPVELVGQHQEATCNQCHQGKIPDSFQDCATCHQPPDQPHFGSECSQCHTPGGWKESVASWVVDVPTIPHRAEGTLDCQSCHGQGALKPEAAFHEKVSLESCLNCHESVPIQGAPVVPHDLEGHGLCLVCHDRGQVEPAPASHRRWTNESCLLCHTLDVGQQ